MTSISISILVLLHQTKVAIANTPEIRLREVLAELADANPAVAIALFSKLVIVDGVRVEDAPEVGSGPTRTDGESSDVEHPNVAGALKLAPKLVQRWEVCEHCDQEYDVGIPNEHGECLYHDGDLECNYDAFEDWDERCHGPMDSSANRREYPENFVWNCCDGDGTTEGCIEDVHKPGGSRKKRARHF